MSVNLSDRPKHDLSEDCFNTEERYCNKILREVQSTRLSPMAIAITGELGSGKTTALNFLAKKLESDPKNVLVRFEPLIEGKVQIIEMLELFYLKLYQSLVQENGVGEVVEKIFTSLLTLLRCKAEVGIEIPMVGNASVSCEPTKNIEETLKLWKKEKPKTFSEEAKELNGFIRKNGYKIYIIIDELDRLPSHLILEFLMFARVLEEIESSFCFFAFDYERIVKKLLVEKTLGESLYEEVKEYIDKLFQCRFHIRQYKDKLCAFAFDMLQEIDRENFLSGYIEGSKRDYSGRLSEIIEYLATPRQIKKWLITVKLNYSIIKYTPEKINILGFLALCVKHPIVIDNISKNVLPLLSCGNAVGEFIKEKYNCSYGFSEEEITQIKVIFSGMSTYAIERNDNLKLLREKFDLVIKNDFYGEKFLRDFYETTPGYLIALYVEGYSDDDEVSAYHDFFEGDVDRTIKLLIKGGARSEVLHLDLSETLKRNMSLPKGGPSMDLLNQLWRRTQNYQGVISSVLMKFSVEQVIEDAELPLSEWHIERILSAFNVSNRNGIYDFKKFHETSAQYCLRFGLQYLKFKGKDIFAFQQADLKEILALWINKANICLEQNFNILLRGRIQSIFYRYIQWGAVLGVSNQSLLASFVENYLNSKNVDNADKKHLIEIIAVECAKYEQPFPYDVDKNPVELWFGNKIELIELIKDKADEIGDINYFDSFCEVVSRENKE